MTGTIKDFFFISFIFPLPENKKAQEIACAHFLIEQGIRSYLPKENVLKDQSFLVFLPTGV
jgi:hypothetical protein